MRRRRLAMVGGAFGGEVLVVPRYCATNSYIVKSPSACLLIDTGLASALPAFNGALAALGMSAADITHVVATHYHPDHIGLMSKLVSYGAVPVAFGCQARHVHDADRIYARDPKQPFCPIDDGKVVSVPLERSRAFLEKLGIAGEAISLPSHSTDSIAVMLDTGEGFVGDLVPLSWIEIGDDPASLDWKRVLEHDPRIVYYGHAPACTAFPEKAP